MPHLIPRRAALAALLAAACGGAGETATLPPTIETTSFASSLGVDLGAMTTTASGLRYRDLVVGPGPEVQAGQTVAVRYAGFHPDGRQFDATSASGPPFRFVLGTGGVIAGWDEGVAGMRVGGRRHLVIPPELGYGAAGSGSVIPPNAILVFTVEVEGTQ